METTSSPAVPWEALARRAMHPVQVEMIDRLDASPDPLSPKGLAGELGIPLANVAYHVQVLRKAGVIRCVKQVPRRGAVEHYYVLAVVRDD